MKDYQLKVIIIDDEVRATKWLFNDIQKEDRTIEIIGIGHSVF